ncbi:uncharacterized protein [Palaemon carinicauda]|uniref:uncharacterized protein isoform X2 n=1 Tax=Palaemon carinicauda TaxID=392227 RepID=UPI0035B5C6C0
MNTKVSSLSQGITCLPATPQGQQFPSERLDETQNPLAYEKDFDREQKRSQDELPEQNVETDYRQRNENQQIPLMREGEIDGTGPGEVINQKNRQDNIDLAKPIHSLTLQSNQQQDNGLIESKQINQGRLPKDWGQSEEIIDWRKWDKGAINSGKREEIPDIQDNNEEARKKWDEKKTDGNMEISPTDDDSPIEGWKKWNRGAINSGKREKIPDIQGSNKEAWKKLDEEETDGNRKLSN